MNEENDYLKYYIAGALTFIGGVLFCIAINMNKIADYITNDGEIDLIIWGKVIPILIFIAFICEIIIKIKGDNK